MQKNKRLDHKLSVLKQIALTQKTFKPSLMVNCLLCYLNQRQQDVLNRRFGLLGKPCETLAAVGKSYKITRERVRQIERAGLVNLKQLDHFKAVINIAEQHLKNLLQKYGGVMEQNHFLTTMLAYIQEINKLEIIDLEVERKHLIFFIDKLLADIFIKYQETEKYKTIIAQEKAKAQILEKILAAAEEALTDIGRPIHHQHLVKHLNSKTELTEYREYLTHEILHAFLLASKKIQQNPFLEWGFSHWPEIKPKRMADKVYVILKKYNKPMHFREIAEYLQKHKFDNKKPHPPTIHNELIADPRFVLIGRGIYGLADWGYKIGTAAEIVKVILQEAGRSLPREEIIAKVLAQKKIKRSTILLALGKTDGVKQNKDGKYYLQ